MPATRPGQRRAYIDLLGVNARGDIHVIETRIDADPMLAMQGLDYWTWATEHREDLINLLRDRDHPVWIDGSYRCLAPNCNGHKQTIIDWEAVALWRNVRHQDSWQELMRRKFVDGMWAPDRDTVLFVGNMEQHPQSFLVLGVFWPPHSPS